MCNSTCLANRIFFFNDAATTEIYTLSLHDALPISRARGGARAVRALHGRRRRARTGRAAAARGLRRRARERHRRPADGGARSEEHTSELQSRQYLVCRLLLEKKTDNSPSRSSSLTL